MFDDECFEYFDERRARPEPEPPPLAIDSALVQRWMAADAVEAYEHLAPFFRDDDAVRKCIAQKLDAHADERWVDAALGVVHTAPLDAVRVLAAVRSQRARDELCQLVEAAECVDAAVVAVLKALFDLGDERLPTLAQRSLERAWSAARTRTIAMILAESGHLDLIRPMRTRHPHAAAEVVRGHLYVRRCRRHYVAMPNT